MCSYSLKRDAAAGEDSWIIKVAELEALLKDKNESEEICLKQLKYARADLENLQKNTERRIYEHFTKEKERLIPQILTVAEDPHFAMNQIRKMDETNLLEAMEMLRRKIWNFLESEG